MKESPPSARVTVAVAVAVAAATAVACLVSPLLEAKKLQGQDRTRQFSVEDAIFVQDAWFK